jgi:hypothetical protein
MEKFLVNCIYLRDATGLPESFIIENLNIPGCDILYSTREGDDFTH